MSLESLDWLEYFSVGVIDFFWFCHQTLRYLFILYYQNGLSHILTSKVWEL